MNKGTDRCLVILVTKYEHRPPRKTRLTVTRRFAVDRKAIVQSLGKEIFMRVCKANAMDSLGIPAASIRMLGLRCPIPAVSMGKR